jgi:hypothetical protein
MLLRNLMHHLLVNPEDGGNISLLKSRYDLQDYIYTHTHVIKTHEDGMSNHCCENLNSYVRNKNISL